MTDLSATGGVAGPGRIGRVAIGDMLTRAARRYPDRVALTDGERRATFAEIDRDANRFANALLARGLKPGDKAATICNNSIEMVKGLFALHRAGLVWTPINTLLGPADMDYILDHAGVRFALIDDYLYAQPDRRAALAKRGLDLVAVDLAGLSAAAGLTDFNAAAARPVRRRARRRHRRSRSGDDHLHQRHDFAPQRRDALPSRRGDGGDEQRDRSEPDARRRDQRPDADLPLRRPCADAELSRRRRQDGADARLRSAQGDGDDPARAPDRVHRPAADVSGDARPSPAQGFRSVVASPLHLRDGADGAAAARARDRRILPEFLPDQRPDRDVSGHDVVAARAPARTLRQLLGRIGDRQRKRDHGRRRRPAAARRDRRTGASRPQRHDGLLQGPRGDRRVAQVRLAPHRRSRADRRQRRNPVRRPQEGHDQVRRRERRLGEDRGDPARPPRRAQRRRGRPAASPMGRGGLGLRQAEAGGFGQRGGDQRTIAANAWRASRRPSWCAFSKTCRRPRPASCARSSCASASPTLSPPDVRDNESRSWPSSKARSRRRAPRSRPIARICWR